MPPNGIWLARSLDIADKPRNVFVQYAMPWLTPKHALPVGPMCYHIEFCRCRSNCRSIHRSAGKTGPVATRLSRSLKVIETDMDRSGTYDFLLVIYNRGLSCTASDIHRDIGRNFRFFLPHVLTPPQRGFPLEFCNASMASMAVWCSGNALVLINAVALHRARLVLGWVTAFR